MGDHLQAHLHAHSGSQEIVAVVCVASPPPALLAALPDSWPASSMPVLLPTCSLEQAETSSSMEMPTTVLAPVAELPTGRRLQQVGAVWVGIAAWECGLPALHSWPAGNIRQVCVPARCTLCRLTSPLGRAPAFRPLKPRLHASLRAAPPPATPDGLAEPTLLTSSLLTLLPPPALACPATPALSSQESGSGTSNSDTAATGSVGQPAQTMGEGNTADTTMEGTMAGNMAPSAEGNPTTTP